MRKTYGNYSPHHKFRKEAILITVQLTTLIQGSDYFFLLDDILLPLESHGAPDLVLRIISHLAFILI
jgi:hypothetical protein